MNRLILTIITILIIFKNLLINFNNIEKLNIITIHPNLKTYLIIFKKNYHTRISLISQINKANTNNYIISKNLYLNLKIRLKVKLIKTKQ